MTNSDYYKNKAEYLEKFLEICDGWNCGRYSLGEAYVRLTALNKKAQEVDPGAFIKNELVVGCGGYGSEDNDEIDHVALGITKEEYDMYRVYIGDEEDDDLCDKYEYDKLTEAQKSRLYEIEEMISNFNTWAPSQVCW